MVNVHELVPVRHLHKVGQVELIVCQVVELVLEDILSLGNVEVSTRALLPGNPDAAPLGKGLEPQACLFLEQLHDVEFAVLPGLCLLQSSLTHHPAVVQHAKAACLGEVRLNDALELHDQLVVYALRVSRPVCW